MEEFATMTEIEPGWYRDPAEPETQRYWDGEQWVGKPVGIDQTPPPQPEPLPAPQPAPDPQRSGSPPARAAGAGGFGLPVTKLNAERLLAGRTVANPGLRLVARLIDILIVAGLNAVVNGWFVYQYVQEVAPTVRAAMANPESTMELTDHAYELQFLILLIALLVWFGYEVPSTVNSGQTLGKRVMGIKVVPIFAPSLRYGSVMSRWSLLMLPVACFPVGVIIAFVDGLWCLHDRPFKQCLHDKSPGTMVVLAGNDPVPISKGDNDVPSDPHRP
jgi:uncharacterized RDD family membrane protein YckC